MLPRILSGVQNVARRTSMQFVRRSHDHGGPPLHELAAKYKVRLSDMPTPKGDWAAWQGKRIAKWNMMLAASAISLTVVLYGMYTTGCFYLHGWPDLKTAKVDPYKVDPEFGKPQ